MRITKRNLKILIERMIKEEAGPEAGPSLRAEPSSGARDTVESIIEVIGDIPGLELIEKIKKGIEFVDNLENIVQTVRDISSGEYQVMKDEGRLENLARYMTGNEESTWLAYIINETERDFIKALKKKPPVGIIVAIYDLFNILPDMIEQSIQRIQTIEGLLEYTHRQLRRPLNTSDFAEKQNFPSINNSESFGINHIIDEIAAAMNYPKSEGKALYNKLIGENIISQEFSSAILKRRLSIREEAGQKIKEQFFSREALSNLSEGELLAIKDALT